MQVSICIATFQRSVLLEHLLMTLQDLRFREMPEPRIEIIVIDNDVNGTAKEVCEKVKAISRWPINYDIEPCRGVTYARDRSISNASNASDFIVMIDDDEQSSPEWLEALIMAQEKYDADIVTGPVLPIFEEPEIVPEWATKGDLFHLRGLNRFTTGQLLETAFTNNVLIRAKIIKEKSCVFNHELAFKGAEDTHLFMKLRKEGFKIIWSEEAIVYESIPVSRVNLKWLMNRAYWGASSYSLFERELYPSLKIQFLRTLNGCAKICLGTMSFLPSIPFGKHRVFNSCVTIAYGLGTISGVFGVQGDWR